MRGPVTAPRQSRAQLLAVAAATLLCLVAGGCAGAMRSGPARGAEPEIFAAVAARLQSDAAGVPLRIDPRPLIADSALVELIPQLATAAPDLVHTPPSALAPVPVAVTEERRRILSRLGITAGEVPTYTECPGGLVPPGRPPGRRSGCPAADTIEAAVSLSRPGGADLPGSNTNAHGDRGRRSVRVIRRELRPSGATQAAYDFVLSRDPGTGWRVSRVVALVIAE
jgi:hypothetical protein